MTDVLILRALGLGDLMTALPALRGIRDHHPEARVTLAAPAWLAPLVGWSGAVDRQLHVASLDHPPPAVAHRPDVAVNLHGRGPQSHRWLAATEPRALVAFCHPDVSEPRSGPAWVGDEHEVDRWCRLVRAFGMAADERRLAIEPPPDPLGGRPRVVLHPGAKDAARRWPADRWAQVAAALAGDGHRVVITGSRDERDLAHRVAETGGASSEDVLAGRLGLLESAGLIAGADLVMSGDTGIAHVATALERPSVVLFGPTAPGNWGPRDPTLHRTLWSGATGDPHGDAPFEGLLRIAVAEVLDASRSALASAPAGATDQASAAGRSAASGAWVRVGRAISPSASPTGAGPMPRGRPERRRSRPARPAIAGAAGPAWRP